MDAITTYDNMRKAAGSAEFFGAELPKLTAATLSVVTKTIAAEELLSVIQGFTATSGWVQFRDQLQIFAVGNDVANIARTDFLEAEFGKPDSSLHIRYLGNGTYSAVTFSMERAHGNVSHAYTEAEYYLRADLAGDENGVLYRHWWHDADLNGDWRPVAQQFIGFVTINDSQGGN